MNMIAEVWTGVVLYSGEGTTNHPAFMDDYPNLAWGDCTGFQYTSPTGKNAAPELGLVAILVTAATAEIAVIQKDARYFVNWTKTEDQHNGDVSMDKMRSPDEVNKMTAYLGKMVVPDSLISELTASDFDAAGAMLKAEVLRN